MNDVLAAARHHAAPATPVEQPLRILHVLDHSLPLHSGYTFRTLAILAEQRKLGWETFQLTGPKQGACVQAEESYGDWAFHRTAAATGLAARLPLVRHRALMNVLRTRIAELADTVRPDIIHAHSPVLDALPAIDVGRARGIPVVYEVRAFWEDAAADLGTAREWGPRYRLTRAAETRALARADAVTTICDGLRRDMLQRGIGADRITVIPNAVDVGRFQFRAPPDASLLAEYALNPGATLGFAGSFYAYEGLDLLLRAMPQVLHVAPQTKLLLLGGGPREASLKALATELRLDDQVHFVGRVPHAEMGRYYSVMDIIVYPRVSRRLTELVTPLKPLEAMAMGKLVAASDVGGHRELIRDEYNGFLFPAGSPEAVARCLVTLLEQPGGLDPVIANARAYVERERTWQASAARYRDVYADARKRARQRMDGTRK